jgi:hypothetical protein
MTDLNRLLFLSGQRSRLVESTSTNTDINKEIEDGLNDLDAETQVVAVDALDALKAAGHEGLSVPEWIAKVRKLHPDADVLGALKQVAKRFGSCVERVGDKRYGWVERTAAERNLDNLDPMTKTAIKGQVTLTYDALAMMRDRESFTKADVVSWLTGRGMPQSQSAMYADHLLTQFGAIPAGAGRFELPKEKAHTKDDSMSLLRSFATTPRDPDI